MERRMDRRERERSRNSDRVDLDSRTPLAWQRRDFQQNFNERYPGVPSSNSDRFSHPSLGSRSVRSAAGTDRRSNSHHHQSNQESDDGAGPSSMPTPGLRGPASKKVSSSSGETGGVGGNSVGGGGNRKSAAHRPSPSSEETTTGSASETETDAERGQQSRPGTSGTLRSMQSMPILSPLHPAAYNPMMSGIYGVVGMPPGPPMSLMHQPGSMNPTYTGEPCPVHGAGLHHHGGMPSINPYAPYSPIYSSMSVRRAPSMHELAAMAAPMPAIMPPPPPSAIYGTLPGAPQPQFLMAPPPEPHHFMMMAGPPSVMGPPPSSIGGRMMRPRPGPGSLPPPSLLHTATRNGRPIVLNGKNGQPEPLPVRDAPPLPPKIPPSDVPSRSLSKSSSAKPFSYRSCCQGNVVVLWVILGIIGLGVVMAVVFYYAFK